MPGRLKLGEILIKAGVISKEQLDSALEDQRHYGGRLATILLERRFITEKIYFKALSSQLKIPAVDFSKSAVPEAICKLVPRDLAEKYVVFPVATRRAPSGNVLLLAMADPTNVEAQDEIRFLTGYKVEPLLGLESTIRSVIREFWFEQGGKGTYRYKPDIELGAGGVEPEGKPLEVVHGEERSAGLAPKAPIETKERPARVMVEHERGQEAPQLTRELKALLKLLSRKGLITQEEYLEIFKET